MASLRTASLPPRQSKVALASFTSEAAKRAIYFDYEGIRTKPPVFIGWLVEGTYAGVIIDSNFHQCAGRFRAKALRAGAHRDAMQILIKRAFAERRHLVSWSWHDLKLIWPLIPKRHQDLFSEHFVNAIRVARPWHAKHFGAGLKKRYAKLSYLASAIGISIPEKYGQKIVANHISVVGKALRAKLKYAALSVEERRSWVAAVKHNQWDLRATAGFCKAVLAGAEPASGFHPPQEFMAASETT